jgi:hypothetical protein
MATPTVALLAQLMAVLKVARTADRSVMQTADKLADRLAERSAVQLVLWMEPHWVEKLAHQLGASTVVELVDLMAD